MNGMTRRPTWDEWGLRLASTISERADCSRRQVGAVILDTEHRMQAAGYNGTYPGGPSCLAGECPRGRSNVDPGSSYDTGPGSCIAVHAEANCLLSADRSRISAGTMYCTDKPCLGCMKLLRNSGLEKVVYPGGTLDPGRD